MNLPFLLLLMGTTAAAVDSAAGGPIPMTLTGLANWALTVCPVIVLGLYVIIWLARRYELKDKALQAEQEARRATEIANLKVLESVANSLDRLVGMSSANSQLFKDEAARLREFIAERYTWLEKFCASRHSGPDTSPKDAHRS